MTFTPHFAEFSFDPVREFCQHFVNRVRHGIRNQNSKMSRVKNNPTELVKSGGVSQCGSFGYCEQVGSVLRVKKYVFPLRIPALLGRHT